ncbi:hypothetical protein EVAR_51324_1 [Eumeta japonica]|uniref:Uncharacterized protein n=1 Tax=Eumeta variegata TaxID=151549 RepID=A0A4C1XVX0_EUMVA|nr:hypothetical protein EVAR_51324_1 [Eumeta japonica]
MLEDHERWISTDTTLALTSSNILKGARARHHTATQPGRIRKELQQAFVRPESRVDRSTPDYRRYQQPLYAVELKTQFGWKC